MRRSTMWSMYFVIACLLRTAISYYSLQHQCPLGESYSVCANADCKCARGDSGIICPQIAGETCKSGCICGKGYLRNSQNLCVQESLCADNQPLCPQGQKYSTCANADCRCAWDDNGIICPELSLDKCSAGCVCEEGFVRNSENICVVEKKCDYTSSCPSGEVYSNCANLKCMCSNGISLCPKISRCIAGCVCDYGFIKNEKNMCIVEELCCSSNTDIPHHQ